MDTTTERTTMTAADLEGGGPPYEGVVYQIYPRSFLDTDGDGIGDLNGIHDQLEYLAWLGVDAVWLSPIFRSPMADFGYDVADYTDVDPVFGDLADADRLIARAHELGLQVWLDWVPNHSSDQHPWFQASRSSREDPKREWYVWRDPAPDGGPPNNWTRHFADAPAWTFDEATGQYYLHLFLPQQPDLNWEHPDLRAAMHDVLRFWLDRGIDGFRADVIHLIGKRPGLPDDPPHLIGTGRAGFHDVEETYEHLRGIREVLDEYDDRLMVGEINLMDAARVATYVGEDRLHLGFFFGLIYAAWEARTWRDIISYGDRSFADAGAWPTWVLGNHDQPRQATRFGSEARARAAAVTLLSLRGVPFLYAGDELGLEDAQVPPDREVDPGGRDGCRAPIPWTPDAGHGWAADPWLPYPPDPTARNVETQRADPGSVMHLYRRLLAHRRESPALVRGPQEVLDLHDDVLAIQRSYGGDERLMVVNLGDQPVEVTPAGTWRVAVSSDGVGEDEAFKGWVDSDQALLLRPDHHEA
jgi:alpha-glucosidase